MIHADLRLANLLVDGDRLGIIDFDDCGFGWFGYDFAAAVSFFEHEPIITELQEAWIRATEVLTIQRRGLRCFPFWRRRRLLTAWIGSHVETPTATEVAESYTGTLALVENFFQNLAFLHHRNHGFLVLSIQTNA